MERVRASRAELVGYDQLRFVLGAAILRAVSNFKCGSRLLLFFLLFCLIEVALTADRHVSLRPTDQLSALFFTRAQREGGLSEANLADRVQVLNLFGLRH